MKRNTRQEELEQFKSQIDFCKYVASRGFTLSKGESSQRSAVMRHPDGDKLIIARGSNRHWKYFNVHDSRDRGTIIDFIQIRSQKSLGEIRKELRPWLGKSGQFTPTSQKIELQPSQHDTMRVLTTWERAKRIEGSQSYLERERRIPSSTLSDPIFADRIRTDRRGNTLFAHYNSDGLCGFEVKNLGFTGFSPGGVKGLFCSRPRSNDFELIVSETAIDTLSYAALFGTKQKRFVSTAGQLSPAQRYLLQSAAKKMPLGSRIVLAMDNDPGGLQLIETITQTLDQIDLGTRQLVTKLPKYDGGDWNDVLRNSLRGEFSVPALGL